MSTPVYALEPFFGGSHKQFLTGLQEHLDMDIRIASMSPHHWKWRMHGSAQYYADLIERGSWEPGVILASDFVHLSALRGLLPKPEHWTWLLYFHENQLTYPFREKRHRDLTYAHMNIQSAMAADHVFFNSAFHRKDFLNAIPEFYQRFVDYKPQDIPGRIREKSVVLPVGLDLQRFDAITPSLPKDDPGIILWNQRWEHDKNPTLFFNTLFHLAEENIPFQLIVCGERFDDYPYIFDTAREKLEDVILHWGYVPDFADYAALLHKADIVVSTAQHEFFGIAAIEALYCRCYPLFPKRLVYPEYIPADRKKNNLYTSDRDLFRKLRFALTHIEQTRHIHFKEIAKKFDWENVAPQWNSVLDY